MLKSRYDILMNIFGQQEHTKYHFLFIWVFVQHSAGLHFVLTVFEHVRRHYPIAVLLLTIAAWSPFAYGEDPEAEIVGDQFESAKWRIQITAPKNWRLTKRSAYENVLAWMVRRRAPSGSMVLTAEAISDQLSTEAYAKQSIAALGKMGFKVRPLLVHPATGANWVDLNNRRTYLRQAYLVANGIAYSLTLSSGGRKARSENLRAFDFALRSIRIDRPTDETAKDEDS